MLCGILKLNIHVVPFVELLGVKLLFVIQISFTAHLCTEEKGGNEIFFSCLCESEVYLTKLHTQPE